jgi:hypothetical protein
LGEERHRGEAIGVVELKILVEGSAEEGFVNQVLLAHLQAFGVHCWASKVTTSLVGGRKHGGGGNSWRHWQGDIRRCLDDKRANVRVTTLIDFYQLPQDWPRNQCAAASNPFERVMAIEAAAATEVNDRRFLPFVVLHEFETLFFADLDKLLVQFPGRNEPVEKLKRDVKDFHCVELIDDGRTTAPSKRVIAEIPEYAGQKASAGPLIAKAVGLSSVRAQCPHFADWLRLLESLGTAADNVPHDWPVPARIPD